MLKRIKIVTSLVLVLVLFGLLQLASGGLFFNSLKHDKENFTILQTVRQQQSGLNGSWVALLQTRNTLNRAGIRYMMDQNNIGSGSTVAELMQIATKSLSEAEKRWAEYEAMPRDPRQSEAAALEIQRNYDIYHGALAELIQLLGAGKINAFFDQPTQSYQDGFEKQYVSYLQQNDKLYQMAVEDSNSSYSQAMWVLICVLITVLAAIIAVWFGIKLTLISPMNRLIDSIRHIASGDLVKRIDVEEDYGVWKEYARRKNLHGAILSYLDIKKDNFYRIENTADGLQFATARGWEDLSELLYAYETLGIRADREVVGQYIQMPRIAKDFANYLEMFYKYQKTYHVEGILSGTWENITVLELREAPFDEKLSVMGLVLSRLSEEARNTRCQDALTDALHTSLTEFREKIADAPPLTVLDQLLWKRRTAMKQAKEAGQLDKESRDLKQREINALEDYRQRLDREAVAPEGAMDAVRGWFGEEVERRKAVAMETKDMFDNAFRFLETTFGNSQELVIFVTEITVGYNTSWFVEQFGCDAYFRHNRELLFDSTRHRIREEIAAAKAAEQEENT